MAPGPNSSHQRQPAAVTYGKSWADDIQKYHVRITASCQLFALVCMNQ